MIDHLDRSISILARAAGNELSSCRRASLTAIRNPMDSPRKTSLMAKLAPSRQLSSSNQNISAQKLDTELNRAKSWINSRLVQQQEQLMKTSPWHQPAPTLKPSVWAYIEDKAKLVNCSDIYLCDGSQKERDQLTRQMADDGLLTPLTGYTNCWLARTDPKDVARVESKTFICTRNKHDVVPRGATGSTNLGNWMHVDELDERMSRLLRNCMTGRRMYVIPFSMGPIGSPLSKVGVQLTDSPYVVVSMHTMTRVSRQVLRQIYDLDEADYVRCLHSVGCPLPMTRPLVNNWPCNPEETIVSHIPERNEIISFGSGYGGNSLLGKKCFALRLGSILGRREGWLAEHMLILGITDPRGAKKYVAAAFPSACGKTNLAMLTPTLPGYKVECVGDDIAWMRFDESGQLRAINPEAGFFGVAPGTNSHSNPNAMHTIQSNTIFTNVAHTSEGRVYWEGLESELRDGERVTDWLGNEWRPSDKRPAAHPNSRFCAPASQCPIIDPEWESAEGVPISAIIFGGRRPEGVPLVYEALDWAHGVFVGASMRSESTAAAADHKTKTIMHDPFAMRPFFGYNFGQYLDHWLSFSKKQPKLKLPKVFHVNWFGKSKRTGEFLWPGFGENCRVLDWICRRIDGESCARATPIGLVPSQGSLNLNGLQKLEESQLFEVSRDFWLKEQEIVDRYLRDNVGQDLPDEIREQSDNLRKRLLQSNDLD